MSDSTAKKLLATLDPLAFPPRMRLLAAETLRLAGQGGGGLDAVLDEFAAGDEYQRGLALTMAEIARRPDRLINALKDPAFRIRVPALFACLAIREAGADAVILATLEDAPAVWRRKLVQAVSAAKRSDLADLLVGPSYRDRLGETETARLLSSCSVEVAAGLLPGLAHRVPNWPRLAARHPQLVIDSARRELAAMPAGSRHAWWDGSVGHGLAAAAAHRPLQVLDLLEEFPSPEGLPFPFLRGINPLLRADEGRTLGLLTATRNRLAIRWRGLTKSTRKRLVASGRPEVVAVGRAVWHDPAAFTGLLRLLPPSARAAFYDAVTADLEPDAAIRAPGVLDALPWERRHAEARRLLMRGELVDRPDERLPVVARLPWDEALPELRAAVRDADPEERAAAYELLVLCAAADDRASTVTGLLTGELGRLRNEQDPVRREALGALATVPARLFEDIPAVAEVLRALVADALAARDCSWATRAALSTLMCRILACQAPGAVGSGSGDLLAWSLTAFEQLAGSSSEFSLGRLDRNLRRGQELAVHRALEPWIARGLARADHRLALALARALGDRAWKIPPLQEAIAHAIRHGTAATARSAIDLWLDDPKARDERVAEIVAWDPTAAQVWRVTRLLCLRRTDLLDPYLTGTKSFKGRFVASGAVWVPGFTVSHRWLPRQSAAYASLLAKIAADQGATIQARVVAVHGLGDIPGGLVGPREVKRYLDSPEVALAEAALETLARGDDPAAALPVLLGYADGDRARVAVYAATRAARFARPSVAAPILRSVALSPTAKVTSRKEALRIAADLELPGLVGLLEEVWRVPGQHRDVKAAVASRLAGRMDDARVPVLLGEAVNDDPAVASQLLRIMPREIPERHRAAYGELVAAAVDIDDPKTSHLALTVAPGWYRWTDSVAAAVCAATTDLDRRGERTGPASAVVALVREGMPIARYLEVLEVLLAADAREGRLDEQDKQDKQEEQGARTDDRDRPARRRLVSMTHSCGVLEDRGERRRLLRATAQLLIGRPGYVRQAAGLMAEAVDLDATPGDLTAALTELADCVHGRCDAAAEAARVLVGGIRSRYPWDARAVLASSEALARRDDPEAALIAVRLLDAAGASLGWPGPYRAAVRGLRWHPDPAVAEAALDVNTGSA